jgi:hypothetical protein
VLQEEPDGAEIPVTAPRNDVEVERNPRRQRHDRASRVVDVSVVTARVMAVGVITVVNASILPIEADEEVRQAELSMRRDLYRDSRKLRKENADIAVEIECYGEEIGIL